MAYYELELCHVILSVFTNIIDNRLYSKLIILNEINNYQQINTCNSDTFCHKNECYYKRQRNEVPKQGRIREQLSRPLWVGEQ
jgi:hypothetical protein